MLYRPISSFEDYRILQSDIDALANWTTSNCMSFNVSKCKTMIISRKKNHGSSFPPLILNGSILDVVPTFKYFGVLFSSNLSWSDHIQGVCSKAHKILGLLYRRYYQYSDSRSPLQLYISLVRPHLDYAAQVWDPTCKRNLTLSCLSVQNLRLKYVQSNEIKAMMDSLNCSLYLQWKTVTFI